MSNSKDDMNRAIIIVFFSMYCDDRIMLCSHSLWQCSKLRDKTDKGDVELGHLRQSMSYRYIISIMTKNSSETGKEKREFVVVVLLL